MNIRFSVIITAYNSEKTISRCLSSIVCSKREDIEILVINDGSIDNTGEICKDIAKKDCRVIYYEKQNGGVSSARNKGLEFARGEFVSFVDSDDFVSSDYFEEIDKELTEKCDLIIFGKKKFDGINYKTSVVKCCYYDNIAETVDFINKALRKQSINSPVNKIYRLDLIRNNNITFPENLNIGEDKVFVVKYLMLVHSVKCIDSPLYIISTENRDSLSRKPRANLCDSILLEHDMMFETVMQSELSDKYKKIYLSALTFSFYRSAYTVIGEIDKFKLSAKEKQCRIKDICRKYKSNIMKKYYDFLSGIIALPIRFGLVRIINLILRVKSKVLP